MLIPCKVDSKKVMLLVKFHLSKREGYKRCADCTVYGKTFFTQQIFTLVNAKNVNVQ